MENIQFKPKMSYFNLSLFVFLVFVTIYGMIGGGGLKVLKVTFIPIVLSAFVVFGKKNELIFEDQKLIIKKQFLGMFYFKDEVVEWSKVLKAEFWNLFGAKRLTLVGEGNIDLMTLKAGEIVPERFDEICELITKKIGPK